MSVGGLLKELSSNHMNAPSLCAQEGRCYDSTEEPSFLSAQYQPYGELKLFQFLKLR